MKRLISAAAVASLLLAGAAFAQTDPAAPAAPAVAANSQCGTLTAEPTLPDAATATPQQITAGNQAYQTWATASQQIIVCRHAEVEQVQARLNALTEEHNAFVRRINSFTQNWSTTTTAYCAREGVRCSQEAPR